LVETDVVRPGFKTQLLRQIL